MLYFRQDGLIYGEASAPVRWENTIAPWLEEQGFERGKNEKSVFYHKERDLLLLLYVDDCLVDGQEEDIKRKTYSTSKFAIKHSLEQSYQIRPTIDRST